MKKKPGPSPTPKRIYAEELCKKHRKGGTDYKSDHALSRILYSKFKKDFSSLGSANMMIRTIRGHAGKRNRKWSSSKHLYTEPNYNKGYAELKDSKEYKAASKRKLVKSKYYIITWAQNNTPVHPELWQNILAYSKFLKSSIHVILGRYKNPTRLSDGDNDEHWASEVLPYADAKRHSIHSGCMIMSDIKTQPTAATPLTGMEGMSGLKSAIFGHPKIQMDTIPALEGYEAKMLFTTGSCTKNNYSDSKAGKKGSWHHTFGFVIIEIKDKEVFIPRQVTACANGSFSDLYHNVKNGKITKVPGIDYMNLGDKHVGEHCLVVESQQRKILDRLKPKYTIIQDVYNGTSVNPHEEKDPIKQFLLQQSGGNIIKKEVDNMLDWINSMKKYGLVIVPSNHNDWLDRYIKRQDWKRDITNAMEYMEYSRILLSEKAPKGLIAYLIDQRFGKVVKTLSRNDSFRVNGIELAQHGDIGANGSRGSIQQFKKLSTKIDVAHSHTPKRLDGVMYVGTSTVLRVGYTIGASSWRSCDIICHKDGKRQQIFYMGPKKDFTTFT